MADPTTTIMQELIEILPDPPLLPSSTKMSAEQLKGRQAFQAMVWQSPSQDPPFPSWPPRPDIYMDDTIQGNNWTLLNVIYPLPVCLPVGLA